MPVAAGYVLAFFALVGIGLAFWAGRISVGSEKRVAQSGLEPRAPAEPRIPPESLGALDVAMAGLRGGSPENSLKTLAELQSRHPDTRSLDFAIALAALQNGNPQLADKHINRSIEKQERLSDSLALAAAIEAALSAEANDLSFGDRNLQRRQLLESAVAADPLNPAPRMELAMLARQERDIEACRAHLLAARNLIHPVDSTVVVDTTLALIEADRTGNLPQGSVGIPGDFAEALLTARQGNPERATQLLESAKSRLPADTFLYLAADPALTGLGIQPFTNAQ